MQNRLSIFAASAAAVTLALSGCGAASGSDTSGSGSAKPYRVLVLGGISAQGALATNAATSVLSAQAGAKAINAEGGILGRQVEVTVADDQADPTVAVTKVQEALNSSTPPDVVLNSGPSTVASATLPLISQAGILSFNIGPIANSADPSQMPLNFDLSPGPTDYLKGYVGYLKDKGYKSVGILHGSSSYGELFGKLTQETLTSNGFTVTDNEAYDVAALDMTPQLSAIQASKPDALVVDAYGAPIGYVLQGIDKLGWNVPIVANNSVAASPIVGKLPPDGVVGTPQVANLAMEVFNSTKYDPSATGVNDAVKTMLSIGPIKASLILAYNYDAFQLINAAAKKTGSLDDPKAIAKALEDPSVTEGAKTVILKRYGFTPQSHSPNVDADEFQFIKSSELKNGQYQ
ncbi:ABC transporter substrate-binding protein [Pseudarthrobacter sp. H2]|uniref:ABC transporter substrate-binding protein n=1 Tax=Pseudarthrobacter sp. H2 TaxID=3418415 RepID=UPI003CF59D64